ncbi:MAG: helix-turn-helix domain-containing protein [Xanthomonadales bacterium]|nr:DUF4115 domain-containing protein [Gammaproteobacteria bacterium]MBT8052710.1 DUF4115 domain-containing protein [Gammaproteobacteria bacterium]NND57372.1 helix-turn-helix domain-containing protein [Xanthomonadales bacterium]NNK50632.1 helix-turn-helix domain-containing protein [Xanthomonadales bacterium]
MTNQRELIPMRPGDILRLARQQQGLTIERASERSRIKPSVLEAIESGQTDKIPSVYLRGYIRNYARYLGVESAELEPGMGAVKGADPQVKSIFTVKPRRSSGEKWLKATSYLAASALIATLAWQFTHEAVRFSQGDSTLSAGTAVRTESDKQAQEKSGIPPRSANTHLNASIASVEARGRPDEPASVSVAEQAWRAVSGPNNDDTAGVPDSYALSITTSADTWVEITDAAGKQLELDLLRAGSSRDYDGQPPFDIMIGRASAVVLNMNGDDIDLVPHTRGNVARMSLQAQ